jgi:hypothetical protein
LIHLSLRLLHSYLRQLSFLLRHPLSLLLLFLLLLLLLPASMHLLVTPPPPPPPAAACQPHSCALRQALTGAAVSVWVQVWAGKQQQLAL